MTQYYSGELSPNERVIPVRYPNGKKAFLVYTQVGNSWVSVLGEETMEDLQVSLTGEVK